MIRFYFDYLLHAHKAKVNFRFANRLYLDTQAPVGPAPLFFTRDLILDHTGIRSGVVGCDLGVWTIPVFGTTQHNAEFQDVLDTDRDRPTS